MKKKGVKKRWVSKEITVGRGISRPQNSMLSVARSRRVGGLGFGLGLGRAHVDDGGDAGPRGLGQRHKAFEDVGTRGRGRSGSVGDVVEDRASR